MDVAHDARTLQPDVVALRRDLHREPEVGLDLPRTRERVLAAHDGPPPEISTGAGATPPPR